MKVMPLLLWFVVAMFVWPGTGGTAEIGPVNTRASGQVAQKTDDTGSGSPGSAPTQEYPLGGTSIEDLLLQKGQITRDEWIQIKAEQEYRVADQSRRIDSLEEWKNRTELLPILRDKVNFGLNALQFLYSHLDADVPDRSREHRRRHGSDRPHEIRILDQAREQAR